MKKPDSNNKELLNGENYKRFMELKSKYDSPIFLTLEKAAEYLGFRPSYMYKLTHTRQIPFYKPTNKKLYFMKSDLDNWIMSNKIKSVKELSDIANLYIQKK